MGMTQKDHRLSAAALNSLQFHLRTPGGSVYGPVSYPTLAHWAEAGRVAAGDEVSHDRKLWMPAANLPDLKMEWLGRRTDGKEFGPFNLLAVTHLVQYGILDPACSLIHRTTGRTLATASLVKPSTAEAPKSAIVPATIQGDAATPPPHWGSAPDVLAASPSPAAPHEAADGEALRDRVRELERLESDQAGRLAKAQDDLHTANLLLEAARVELERQKQNARAAESSAQADTKTAKNTDRLRRENDELKRVAAKLTKDLEEEKRASADRSQQNTAELHALRLLNEDLNSKCADAQSRITSLQRDLAAAHNAAEALRREWEQRTAQAAAAQTRATELEEKLNTTERQSEAIDKLRCENDELKRVAANLTKSLDEVKRVSGDRSQQNASELHALRLLNEDLNNKCADAQSRTTSLQRDLVKAQIAAEEELRQEREQSATQAAATSSRMAEMALKLEMTEQQRAHAERTLAEAKRQVEARDRKANNLQRENLALRTQVSAARDLYERTAADYTRDLANLRGLASPAEWKVKIGETVYGPVSTAGLFAWAADCRIAPDTNISRDGTQWSKAREVPELRMEWNTQLIDGTAYGPVNLLSVPHLIRDGVVQPDGALTHCRTGTILRATELAQPLAAELQDAILRLEKDLADSRLALRVEEETRAAIERHLHQITPAVPPPPAAVPTPPPIVTGTLRARASRVKGA